MKYRIVQYQFNHDITLYKVEKYTKFLWWGKWEYKDCFSSQAKAEWKIQSWLNPYMENPQVVATY